MAYQSHLDSNGGAWTYLRAHAYVCGSEEHAHDAERYRAPGFTIAISSEAGVDRAGIAANLGQRLGWPVWDHELLLAVAQRLHLPASELTAVDETHVSWLQESLESLLAFRAVSQVAFVHQLVKIVEALGEHGECIVVGRGAAHILPLETTLRVRLVAPLRDRVTVMRRMSGITRAEDAQREVEKLNSERTRFVLDHFHKDPTDPTNYDLVLNVSRLTSDDCVQQIIDALHAEQAHRV